MAHECKILTAAITSSRGLWSRAGGCGCCHLNTDTLVNSPVCKTLGHKLSQNKNPFISLIFLTTAGVMCLCGGCKKSPRTTSLCSHIFLVLRDHGVYMYDVYI